MHLSGVAVEHSSWLAVVEGAAACWARNGIQHGLTRHVSRLPPLVASPSIEVLQRFHTILAYHQRGLTLRSGELVDGSRPTAYSGRPDDSAPALGW